MSNKFPNLTNAITGVKDAFVNSGGGLKGALSATGASFKGLGSIIKAHPFATLAIGIGIASAALKMYREQQEKYQESLRDIISAADENIQKYTEEKDALLSLQDRLDSAKNNKTKLLLIQEDLNKAIGETPGLLEGEGNAYEKASAKIQARITELDELAKKEAEAKIKAQKEIFETNTTPYKMGVDDFTKVGWDIDIQEAVSELNRFKAERQEFLDAGGNEDATGFFDKKIARYTKILQGKVKEAQEVFADYIDIGFNDDISKSYANKYIESLIFGGEDDLDEIQDKLDKFKPKVEEFNGLKDELLDLQLKGKNTDEVAVKIQNIIDEVKKASPEVADLMQTSLNSILPDEKTISVGTDKIKISFSELIKDDADNSLVKSVENYQTEREKLKEAYDKFMNGTLSDEDLQKLIEEFPELAGNTEDLGGSITGLLDTMDSDMASKFAEAMGEMATDEDKKKLKAYANTVLESTSDLESFANQMSAVQGLSEGFDILSPIYEDIKNGEAFDWSSILNNDKFKETFSKLGKDYDNFIKTITDNPDDIDKCQDAFDRLATAYIRNAGILRNLTDETRNYTISMLKQMGVSNAEEIVDNALTVQKEKAKLASEGLTEATYAEIYAKYDNANASLVAKQALAELAVEKFNAEHQSLSSSDDVEALIELAGAANVAAKQIGALNEIKRIYQSAETRGFMTNEDRTALIEAKNALKDGLEFGDVTINYKPSSSSGSSSSSEDKDTKEKYDWIEIALSRIQRVIKKLGDTASNTYKSLKTRLGATKKELKSVNKELSLQQKAYEQYMRQANSVKLSDSLKKKVREGAIDINKYDSDTRELIGTYKEWYEKALEAKDAIDELHKSLADLYSEKFNNIKSDFDNRLSQLEHKSQMYESAMSLLEAKGYTESTQFYKALQAAEKENVAMLQNELDALRKAFKEAMNSGEIEEYSEAWFSMKESIYGVEEAIAEANVQLAEYANKMREIEWGHFDYLQDRISQLTSEAEFLIELMSSAEMYNDDGSLSNEGLATMGLHAQSYCQGTNPFCKNFLPYNISYLGGGMMFKMSIKSQFY